MSRIQERAIEQECERTLIQFYHSFDEWDYEAMLQLCTPDCLWHRSGKDLYGHEAILQELQKRTTTQVVRHVLTNILVHAHGAERASLKCLMTAYRYDDGIKPVSAPLIERPILLLVVTADLVPRKEQWVIHRQIMRREFRFDPIL